jgi:hypothetical protein
MSGPAQHSLRRSGRYINEKPDVTYTRRYHGALYDSEGYKLFRVLIPSLLAALAVRL